MDVSKLRPHPKNPNRHNERQISLLSKIIQKAGWRNPIVVSKLSGFIVKGHGRYEAAKVLGLKQAPVDLQDYADEAQELADMVADNRLAELSSTDDAVLRSIMKELEGFDADLDMTGFGKREIEALFESNAGELPLSPSLNQEQAPEGEEPPPLPSHVRMVQLFFNSETQPVFIKNCDALRAHYRLETITDTVFKAIQHAADQITP